MLLVVIETRRGASAVPRRNQGVRVVDYTQDDTNSEGCEPRVERQESVAI